MQGALFTHDFLKEGIKETEAWAALTDDEVAAFKDAARIVFNAFPHATNPNESQTEDDLIWKVLGLLDWHAHLRQQNMSAKGKEDVPDGLLFPDEDAKTTANTKPDEWRRYEDGVCIIESKRWGRKLDRKDALADDSGVPSTQMLRYLRRLDDITQGKVRWGILSNGRQWRLYFQGATSVSEEFLELDLAVLLGLEGFDPDLFDGGDPDHFLRVFIIMFGREAFLPDEDGRTFHQLSLEEGQLWERRVAENLSGLVFNDVFPSLVKGLVAADPERPDPLPRVYLDEARDGALILLYRLLFVLYAEDRNLLPVRDGRYDDYGMRLKIRQEVARRVDEGDVFAKGMGPLYQHMQNLFKAISEGEEDLGLPPYNGGLFQTGRVPILDRAVLPDAVFATCVDSLSRLEAAGGRHWINYRDLTVRQLGSIYESLLEHEVVEDGGIIFIRPNIFARKTSGSYYTPDDLVRLIIERTLNPMLDERRAAFEAAAEKLKSSKVSKEDRLVKLASLDPANAFLDLKVCDPAMGSGHFLVDLVDFMADEILEATAWAEQVVDWADYVSPVSGSIAAIRARILEQAKEHDWANIDEDQLDDRQIVRRMILKRVIYGVDKNPMAVELAKVSLWLHTFTIGAPLSFLDHHLRCGDSLFGEFVRPIEDDLAKRGNMFLRPTVQQGMNAAKGMMAVERLTDADIAEAKSSAKTFEGVSEDTAPLVSFLSLVHALRWLSVTDKGAKAALDALLDGIFGDPLEIAAGTPPEGKKKEIAAFQKQLDAARNLDVEQHFMHWEVAFPGVWTDWESAEPQGGFDAIVGNPPWDRIKLQEVEWFAARKPEIAHAAKAADRKKMIAALKKNKDPLYDEFMKASAMAESAAKVARTQGQYPLLSGGDVNLYSLFVERAQRLIRPHGVMGLLVPSGIASDLGASKFFKDVSTGGRLAALLDFENKKVFFPDVHASFKFCAFVAGGAKRKFDEANCGFFFHNVNEVTDGSFVLLPEDFAAVNPNTGTAPIFRTKRDAELTKAIYNRVPVFVNRSTEPIKRVWPVKYTTMFHMTNDSDLFYSVNELEDDGCYRIDGNRWKKGKAEYVPLYVGRMIHQFDHRAASVEINDSNLHNQALSVEVTHEQHKDVHFSPTPQYWISSDEMVWPDELEWGISFRDIARTTDVRTLIFSCIPRSGAGNTLPMLLPVQDTQQYKTRGPLFLANFNAIVLDYVARQKVQSTHLNWYIIEQLPILLEEAYDIKIGGRSARDIVREEVLKLTYTSNDMEPFARDMGYDGDPFIWDEDERRHSRARLDALYFILYGIEREDADYILSTFPIVRRHDEAAHDRFLTRDLILGYMAAFEADDTKSRIKP